MAFYSTQTADGANTGRGITLDLVAGERLSTILDGQRILGHPHHYLCSGKSLFGVKPEALEDEVAQAIEGTCIAGREERPGEIFSW